MGQLQLSPNLPICAGSACALVPRLTPGVTIGRRHLQLGATDRVRGGARYGGRALVQGQLHSDGAAAAAIGHIHDWAVGSGSGDWVGVAVPSDGSYGIPAGVIYSYPVTCQNGQYAILQALPIDDFSRSRMQATYDELCEERDGVKNPL